MISERIEPYKQTVDVNLDSLEKNKTFENIKTPAELLTYMQENIEYGFVGKDNNKIYSPKNSDWGIGDAFPKEYFLQSPEQLLESKYGTCWDQTELERDWFLKNNYEFKTFIAMFDKEISQKSPAHTFLAYKNKDKWNWFENALDKKNGIHEFENINDLINEVKEEISNNAANNGATEAEMKKFKLSEYKTPKYGCSTEEFMNNVI